MLAKNPSLNEILSQAEELLTFSGYGLVIYRGKMLNKMVIHPYTYRQQKADSGIFKKKYVKLEGKSVEDIGEDFE